MPKLHTVHGFCSYRLELILNLCTIIRVGGGGQEGCSPKLGRNPFHPGKFPERTIGNLSNVSACSPALFDISGRKLTAPLNLTSSYAHVYHSSLHNVQKLSNIKATALNKGNYTKPAFKSFIYTSS